MSLDELLGTIRAAGDDGDGADPELAAATRLRVVRSLETRARSRHQLVGVATTIAILLAGTVSWALATGQVAALWSPAPAPAPRVVPEQPPSPVPRHRQAMAIEPRPSLPPEAVAPPVPVPAPRPARRAAVAAPPVEALYRRAHDLHFHGSDPAATLAAWDRYLAAEPDGRFSVEARYNRALVLIRLGRHAEARAALIPFARGEVVPVGYRQAEAEQLVERLAPDP